jgi:hypothetical protein
MSFTNKYSYGSSSIHRKIGDVYHFGNRNSDKKITQMFLKGTSYDLKEFSKELKIGAPGDYIRKQIGCVVTINAEAIDKVMTDGKFWRKLEDGNIKSALDKGKLCVPLPVLKGIFKNEKLSLLEGKYLHDFVDNYTGTARKKFVDDLLHTNLYGFHEALFNMCETLSKEFSQYILDGNMHLVNDDYIAKVSNTVVQKLLSAIKKKINHYETYELKPYDQKETDRKVPDNLKNITKVDDVVFSIKHIGRYRRGYTYAVLQISSKDNGTLRLSVYTTDTVFHDGQSFGTTPDVSQAADTIVEYFNNIQEILEAIEALKKNHPTKKTAKELLENIQF